MKLGFKPDYNKCVDNRKQIACNHICIHVMKNTYMYCQLFNNKKCIAWEGYKHNEC